MKKTTSTASNKTSFGKRKGGKPNKFRGPRNKKVSKYRGQG
jgi:hypothetical protein